MKVGRRSVYHDLVTKDIVYDAFFPMTQTKTYKIWDKDITRYLIILAVVSISPSPFWVIWDYLLSLPPQNDLIYEVPCRSRYLAVCAME